MKYRVTVIAILIGTSIAFAQQKGVSGDTLKTRELEEVFVSATRAGDDTPMAYSNVDAKQLKSVNLGQDLPILLNLETSMVTTSDAGAGVGYTGMRIRGSDATRINVTVNGIPLNDSESQGVFWVNMPDFASTTSSIQIQRGVGTSTNGAGAFGATVNLETNNPSTEAFAEINNSYGSFNTRKHNVIVNSGLINDRWAFEGRLSQIASDGYIDRAWSDLKSYYLSGGYYGEKTIIKALVFGGLEETYQAWYGTPQAKLNPTPENDLQSVIDWGGEYSTQEQIDNLLNSGRTFNYYLYDNEIDHYQQDHYQLHFSHQFNPQWSWNTAFHYTYGRGYYEQYKDDEDLADYQINYIPIGAVDTIKNSDIIRRRWLDNDFYGLTYSLDYSGDKLSAVLGGGYNEYDGDHFGEVIWAQFAGNSAIRDTYYDNVGRKTDFNTFLKANYQFNSGLSVFADAQVRNVQYETYGVDSDLRNIDVNEDFTFFNPKVGLSYELNTNARLYGSFAIGNREPVRTDFIDSDVTPKHETLQDFEFGYRQFGDKLSFSANGYYMNYKNQLVLTGELNDVGSAIRTNVNKSYRMGLELEAKLKIIDRLSWDVNLALSQNKIDEFTEVLYDYFDYSVVNNTYQNTDIAFSPNVIAGSRLTYSPFDNFEIQWMSKYVGKQYLDNTSNENRVIEDYFIDDLRISYNFSLKTMKNIGVTVLVNNVFNQEYSSNGYTWGYLYEGWQYQQNNYYPQAGTNFLASLTLRF